MTIAAMPKRIEELEAHTHALTAILLLISRKIPGIREELTQYGLLLETHPDLPSMGLAQALRSMKFLGADL
ncbi:hypothetical protein J2739_002747 [Variovorax soli]|uniref:Uncharacterized protein n=2 Tax=Variovorax soli TaxID=376815 RepID=A0ABU1NEX9_9BURK|nr:hypothetical protein [Variovorax soli]